MTALSHSPMRLFWTVTDERTLPAASVVVRVSLFTPSP